MQSMKQKKIKKRERRNGSVRKEKEKLGGGDGPVPSLSEVHHNFFSFFLFFICKEVR